MVGLAVFPKDLNLLKYSLGLYLAQEWPSQRSTSPSHLSRVLFDQFVSKIQTARRSNLLVSPTTRGINRSKRYSSVELFKLYTPVQKCSEDSAESPENKRFFSPTSLTQNWVWTKSQDPLEVLRFQVHPAIELVRSNKLATETPRTSSEEVLQNGEKPFLMLSFQRCFCLFLSVFKKTRHPNRSRSPSAHTKDNLQPKTMFVCLQRHQLQALNQRTRLVSIFEIQFNNVNPRKQFNVKGLKTYNTCFIELLASRNIIF